MTTPLLEKAIVIAIEAHRGQTDKAGAPYILHPLRVMLAVSGDEARLAAVLHDVLEDSDWTTEALRACGLPEAVLAALDCLTHRDGEPYEGFIARVAANPIARQVKLADLEDNMDLRRLDQVTPQDVQRLERYHRAWATLVCRASRPGRS